MEKLNISHIQGLIDSVEYEIKDNVALCMIHVGDSTFVGTSHKFSNLTYDQHAAKASAYNDAENQVFAAEAYHQKRLRSHRSKSLEEFKINSKVSTFDPHLHTAALLFTQKVSQVTDDQRNLAKEFNMMVHEKIQSIQD